MTSIMARGRCVAGVLRGACVPVLQLQGPRHIFTPGVLGMDAFAREKQKASTRFLDLRDQFSARMRLVLEDERHSTIFTEDLKNMVHLATDDDVQLVYDMAKRFNQQNRGLRFGNYIFGPVIMRMLFDLDKPHDVVKFLTCEDLDGLFDQMISYQVGMTLLYDHAMYEELFAVFGKLQAKRLLGSKYPKNCFTLAIAACYKMNTPESLQRATALMADAEECGLRVSRRCYIMVSGLAVRQGFPHLALDHLPHTKAHTQVALRNIKIMSLVSLGRVEEALPILRAMLEVDLPDAVTRRPSVFRETAEALREQLEKEEDKSIKASLDQVLRSFDENKSFSDQTLDAYISQPIDQNPERQKDGRQDRAMLAASFSQRQPRPYRRPTQQRRGLFDAE